jgi:hypothetical protein
MIICISVSPAAKLSPILGWIWQEQICFGWAFWISNRNPHVAENIRRKNILKAFLFLCSILFFWISAGELLVSFIEGRKKLYKQVRWLKPARYKAYSRLTRCRAPASTQLLASSEMRWTRSDTLNSLLQKTRETFVLERIATIPLVKTELAKIPPKKPQLPKYHSV